MTATSNDVPEVLFVCVHNAGRSQMAAATSSQMGEANAPSRRDTQP
jgi:protein-tyrosine-phosphatase